LIFFLKEMGTEKTKEFKNIITESIFDNIEEDDIINYVNLLKDKIVIKEYPIKLKLILTCEFSTAIAFNIIEAHYSHPIQIIQSENNLTVFYDDLIDKFNAWLDAYQERGSGHVFIRILSTEVKQYKYNYQKGSSYIPLEFKSSNIINIQNKKDNKCFLWSILAKLFPVSDNKERVTKYREHEDKIIMDGIDYPVRIKDIPKVEKQNNLSINVFALRDQKNKQSLFPVYNSNIESEYIIDLLYIENQGNTHYCLIKDLNSFRCGKDKHKQYTCRNCLQGFQRKEALENHKEKCLAHKHCNVIMPEEGKNILKFEKHHFSSKLPIAIYCDFESNNIPIKSCRPDPDNSFTNQIFKQEINSYGIYIKSDYHDIYKSEYISYVGDDAKEKYVKDIVRIFNKITYQMHVNEKKTPILTDEQEKEFQEATECYICKKEFENKKIREHNHFNGKYRGAACISCNTKEGKCSKIIPVFFHNGSGYDFHFIIEELMKYENKFNKVKVLSKSAEEYISIDYGSAFKKLRFLDSYRFLQKGLSDVAKSLKEFPILESEFKNYKPDLIEIEKAKKNHLRNYKEDIKEYLKEKLRVKNDNLFLLKQKGFYPYEYIDSIERLEETELPTKEKWFSTLTQTKIEDIDLEHAKTVWKTFKCKTLKDYHNLYLKTDVLILADAFEQFREFFLKHHQIDPCYCFSAPGLTWQCGLKYTGVELELLTDYDMLLMFEKGIRGGFSGVLGPRHVKAFNKYTDNYDENYRILDENEGKECLEKLKRGEDLTDFLKEKFLLYLDANNLYGWAMSQELPTKDFKWEESEEYYKHIPKGRGCIVECDLEYTEDCKQKTKNYPLAPEHFVATEDMLSDYQLDLLDNQKTKLGKEKKLFLTLYNKKNYVVHDSILKDYIKLGMKVTKVHRTISFEESDWLKSYIDFNTKQRKKAETDFEKDLWKLMNNSFYGKTMENIRGRSDIKLFTDEEIIKKYISKPNFKDSNIFNDNLVAIINNITSIKFDKPIYLGQVILDYSKQLMYNFYYEIVNKLWPDNELVASDTDSIFLNIKAKDIYEDMKGIMEELDTSAYPEDHPLYSEKNKKVIGKFKDELNGEIMKELIFLRSKVYSYKTGNKECKKLKGISRSVVKKDITHDDYKRSLFNNKIQLNKMYRLNSDKHEMFVSEVNKVSLNPFDDKRYICDDGIETLPYGLYFT